MGAVALSVCIKYNDIHGRLAVDLRVRIQNLAVQLVFGARLGQLVPYAGARAVLDAVKLAVIFVFDADGIIVRFSEFDPGRIRTVMGTDRSTSVNCVQFEGKRYFDYEELKTKLRKPVVPKGYVLLNGDFTSSEELVVGELVPREYITGKVSTVLYPFSLFGRSADYLKK